MHGSKFKTLKCINNLTKNFIMLKDWVVVTCKQEEDSSNEEAVTSFTNLHRGESTPTPTWSGDSVNELKFHNAVTSHEKNRTETMDRPLAQ